MELELPAIVAANEAYQRAGLTVAGRRSEPARHLVILTCMDARLDLFGALGLEVGDAHILRNAGGRASPDAIRSLVVSAHLLGTREVGVVHHTKCGLEGSTQGSLSERTGVAGLDFLAFADLDESVREDVAIIRGCGLLPAGFVVWGAVYDVDTGALRLVPDDEPAG
jgi:carbonic anhydrase